MDLLTVFAFLVLISATKALPSISCRCTSGQSCWPTQADFQTLASQVSQPLIYPLSPASACYPVSSPSGNCTEVQQGWRYGNWRANQTGALQNANWETFIYSNGTIDACYLNTTLGFPCKQGSIPPIGVDVRSPADIQAAVRFASKHNLRVVIKNTGSTARGAFMIWTHHLKNITFHDTFTPDGCSASYDNVLSFGSGVQWFEGYQAAAAHNRVIVGGISSGGSVGSAGGWVSGGGHSVLSPNYGLGVDNVVQMTIVTADGSHLTVNEQKSPDLFWALRGGGGGTYGVLTSVSYKTHPSTPFIGALFYVNRTNPNATDPNAVEKIMTELIRLTPTLVDKGFGAYSGINQSSLYMSLVSPNVSWAQANETLQPLFDYAQSLAQAGGLAIGYYTVPYPSFMDWYQQSSGSGTEFWENIDMSSWLLPRDVILDNPRSISHKLMQTQRGFSYMLVTGGVVSKVNPNSTGISPAWRNSLALINSILVWPEGTNSSEIAALREGFKKDMALIESIAPDSGAYLNEASSYEFDWKMSFFGSHYNELKAIKYKYDPEALFVVWEGVGSDDFDASLNCRI